MAYPVLRMVLAYKVYFIRPHIISPTEKIRVARVARLRVYIPTTEIVRVVHKLLTPAICSFCCASRASLYTTFFSLSISPRVLTVRRVVRLSEHCIHIHAHAAHVYVMKHNTVRNKCWIKPRFYIRQMSIKYSLVNCPYCDK